MSIQLRQEIQKLTEIQVKSEDYIGEGQSGLVYRCWINNILIAVKCFENEQQAQDEMNILNKVQSFIGNCPGILECYGMKKIQIKMLNDVSEKYVIFLQACQIDLKKRMEMMQKLQPTQVLNLLSQLSLSLLCIHLNNGFHGDIKPANILINQNQQHLSSYFTDFGTGKVAGTYLSIDFELKRDTTLLGT